MGDLVVREEEEWSYLVLVKRSKCSGPPQIAGH